MKVILWLHCQLIVYIFITDAESFTAYLENVCQRLPDKSFIILDNASYHTKFVSTYSDLDLNDTKIKVINVNPNYRETTIQRKIGTNNNI